MPRSVSRLKLHKDSTPIYHHYNVEDQVTNIYDRRVTLDCGATLVIEQTEALVSIDVNSGTYHGPSDPEKAALEINLHAAREIARQIRLRDLGGVIICDFIDMRDQANKTRLERELADMVPRRGRLKGGQHPRRPTLTADTRPQAACGTGPASARCKAGQPEAQTTVWQ